MGADRDRAEHDDQADDGVRDQVEQRPERAEQARLLDLGLADLGGLGVVPGRGLPPPAERLQHPDAGGRLLDHRGQVALLVLDPAGQHPVALLEPEADRQHRREHHAGDQAQPPVEVDQQRHHRDERHDVGDQEDQAEAREPADRRQVGRGPRQELTRLPVVVEGRLQPLQVGVQVVPDRLLDVRDRAGLDPAADHVQQLPSTRRGRSPPGTAGSAGSCRRARSRRRPRPWSGAGWRSRRRPRRARRRTSRSAACGRASGSRVAATAPRLAVPWRRRA